MGPLGSQGSHPLGSQEFPSIGIPMVPLPCDPLGSQGSPPMGSLGLPRVPSHGIPWVPKGSPNMGSLGLPRVPSHAPSPPPDAKNTNPVFRYLSPKVGHDRALHFEWDSIGNQVFRKRLSTQSKIPYPDVDCFLEDELPMY